MIDHFSSKDFHNVPNQLEYKKPHKPLLHRQVRKFSVTRRECALGVRRGHLVRIVDVPSKVMSMTMGRLRTDESTRKHRHNYETIIYVLSGLGKSIIEEEEIHWKAGDAFYVPCWAWHQHINLTDEECWYIACENAPLLQNLGIALREEA